MSLLIYKPINWQVELGYKVNPDHCRAAVHETHGVGFRQCTRKPTQEVDGFRLCTQHAKRARSEGIWAT